MTDKPILMKDPQPYSAGFTFDLYCKYLVNVDLYSNHGNYDSFAGPTRSHALEDAKAAGWVLHRDRTATCPTCAKKLGLRK